MNFCDAKFISFEAFEQLNRPTPSPPFRSTAARSPAAARSRASSHVALRRLPSSRTIGSVSRDCPSVTPLPPRRSGGASMLYLASPPAQGGPAPRSDDDALGVRVDVAPPLAHEPDDR